MICFLILHYLVLEETQKCVDSIINNVKGEKKIIIVDNCSPNNSYEQLKEYYNNNDLVEIIQNNENNGFAKGNNFGYTHILNQYKPDFICCMNNDMEINQPNFIELIYNIYDRTGFYVLGPDIYSPYYNIHQNPEKKTIREYKDVCEKVSFFEKERKRKIKFYLKGYVKSIKVINNLYYHFKKKKANKNIEWKKEIIGTALHGSCLIFSKKFINARNYAFYPETNFYCEAQILDYECRRDNMLMVYSPELKVIHYEDKATNAVFRKYALKAIFVNECMYNSLLAFKSLMEKDINNGQVKKCQ